MATSGGRGYLSRERGSRTRRETTYRQDFPFAGMPHVDELRRVSDNRLFERTTYEHVENIRGKIHEPQLRSQSKTTFGGPDESNPLIEISEFARVGVPT